MEKIINDEKQKKLSMSIKNKFLKGYQRIRNKTNTNYFIPKIKENINYYQTFDKSSNNLSEESYNSFQIHKKNSMTNYNDLKNLKIQHLSKEKKDDYNNTLNRIFFTTSNIIKHKKDKLREDLLINSYYNMNLDQNDIKGKNRILNKLFPDIDEMNKYSSVPFFALMKKRTPFKMKLNLGLNNKQYKIKQEEFLYKISHNNLSNDNYNFNKNKGIKKGRTTQYFHGVDKFCVNNKISETNFPLKESLKKNKLNLELDIENITKGGERTSQMSNKEKKIKMLENNVNNIKSIPNDLVNDLEDEVFKMLDEEFDKNYNTNNEECQTDKREEEIKDNINSELNSKENQKEDENKIFEDKNNINNLNIEFISNKKSITKASSNKNYFKPNILKKPNKYPVNFYTTQQVRNKEHFSTNSKITFEERIKMLKKKEQKEKEEKNLFKMKNGLNLENTKDLKLKRGLNIRAAYKKQCRIRDILIGNKLKSTYDPIDTKRILNGLKPWIYIRSDEKKEVNLDNLKQKLNEDIKNIL